jgi:hypothetical protein
VSQSFWFTRYCKISNGPEDALCESIFPAIYPVEKKVAQEQRENVRNRWLVNLKIEPFVKSQGKFLCS